MLLARAAQLCPAVCLEMAADTCGLAAQLSDQDPEAGWLLFFGDRPVAGTRFSADFLQIFMDRGPKSQFSASWVLFRAPGPSQIDPGRRDLPESGSRALELGPDG